MSDGVDTRVESVPLLHFALPCVAGSALLYQLLTQDKRVSRWEGLLFSDFFALFVWSHARPA